MRIAHITPFANDIPRLRPIQGPDTFQEYLDLLGDTRFRTLRIHCLGLKELQRNGIHPDLRTRRQFEPCCNKLRDIEATPHKIQWIWVAR